MPLPAPHLSVVCPTCNRDPASTLESVRAQSVREWELLAVPVCDDGTEDAAAAAARRPDHLRRVTAAFDGGAEFVATAASRATYDHGARRTGAALVRTSSPASEPSPRRRSLRPPARLTRRRGHGRMNRPPNRRVQEAN